MNKFKVSKSTKVVLLLLFTTSLSACKSTNANLQLERSYLKDKFEKAESHVDGELLANSEVLSETKNNVKNKTNYLAPFRFNETKVTNNELVVETFSEVKTVQIASDDLPLNEFLHYVMGEVLNISYILGNDVKNDTASLTLNLQESVSHRKLFTLVEELLAERGYVVRYNDNIYYINKESSGGIKNISFGYGNKVADVPNSQQEIWQLAPFDYGYNGSLQLSLTQLANVLVYPDPSQNAMSIRGKRAEVIKALEFMALVDKPRFNSRHVAIYNTIYTDAEKIIIKIEQLLSQEGITVGKGAEALQALSIVPLDNMGAFALFANKKEVIDRAVFWAKQTDQPQEGKESQYFIYSPKFSRAADLGASLNALLGGSSSADSTSAQAENKRAQSAVQSTGIASSNVGLVVDERANSLIFLTSGGEYRKLLPIIKRLDVMPKQVMLEVMIAEIKLTDEFKQGVEFSLTNQGATKVGGYALGSSNAGLSYILSGTYGKFDLSLFQKNTNVEVLSRPSLLVRDGVEATITVGDDIPTVGEIITDPINGSKSSVVYRKTGVDLSVTPTINAQGVVIMEISQKISNQAPGDDSVAGSPVIFERSIRTEVVAESGQTVILGGLISEDRTLNERGVPFFSSIPILGHLFDGTTDSKNKTELVVMVTPRVIEANEEWIAIKAELAKGLQLIDISNN